MSSMKANIERAAELLDVSTEALTEYMLDRDPQDGERGKRASQVRNAAVSLGIHATELVLVVVDIHNADPAACREHLASLSEARGRAEMRETSAITEANRAGIAIRALNAVRGVLSRPDSSVHARLADVNVILSNAGY